MHDREGPDNADRVGAFFTMPFRILLVLLATINMLTSLYYGRQLEFFTQPLRLLNVLINVARRIGYQFERSEISEETEKAFC